MNLDQNDSSANDENLPLVPVARTDETQIMESLPASPEDLKALYQVADQALGVLVSTSRDFAYSLPVQTPLGVIRIQKANSYVGVVRFEVRQDDGDTPMTFTLSAQGKLIFDVPESARPKPVAVDIANGVAGVLASIVQNVAAARKSAEIDQSTASQLVACLQAEVDYYENGGVETDLQKLEAKMDEVSDWVRNLPEESQKEAAREKLAQPYVISIPVMGDLLVNFYEGTIDTAQDERVLRLGVTGMAQYFLSEQSYGLSLPKGILQAIVNQVEAIQPALEAAS